MFQRDRLAQQLVARRGYLHKLLEIFRVIAGWVCGWVGGLSRAPSGCLLVVDAPCPAQLSEARHACYVWEPSGQHTECESSGADLLRGAGEARAWDATCLPACLLCCCPQMCEDLEDDDSLQTLFTIFKQSERLLLLWVGWEPLAPC